MSSYLWELLIWALGSYVVGCVLGCFARKLFAEPEVVAAPRVAAPVVTPPPPPKVVAPPPPPPPPPKVVAPPPPPKVVAPPPPPKVVAPPPPPKVVAPPPPPKVVVPPPPPKPVAAHHKAEPLAVVRAGTTQLSSHITRKAEEVHYDKNIRRVEGTAPDRKVETRHGTHSVSTEPHRVATPVQGKVTAAETVRTVVQPAVTRPVVAEPVITTTVFSERMTRPKGLSAARNGKPDNLQRISGVGPKNEQILHKLGFFHFDQIAAWTTEQVAWVDDHLKFGGRIGRENWREQATLLASGKEDEFARLYGTGGLKNAKGETQSGSKTRR